MVEALHERKMSIFIAIEGGDRVGKKTQTQLLKSALELIGNKTVLVEVPWNDRLTYRAIYYMLEHGLASKYPTLFQVVQNVNKFLCQALKFIQFKRNDYVIFDRWRLSSDAYGTLTGANKTIVKLLFSILLTPDITIVLNGKKLTDVCEDEYESNDSLQRKVRMYYKNVAPSVEHNCVVVNVDSKSREKVHEEVMIALGKSGLLTFRAV